MNEENKNEEGNVVNLEEEFRLNSEVKTDSGSEVGNEKIVTTPETEDIEIDVEKLIDKCREDIEELKKSRGDFYLKIDTALLGEAEGKLWHDLDTFHIDAQRSYLKDSMEGKIDQYDAEFIQMQDERGHDDPEVEAKKYFLEALRDQFELKTMSAAA